MQPVRDRVRLCGWICHQLFILTIRHTTLARSRSATDLLVYVIVLRYIRKAHDMNGSTRRCSPSLVVGTLLGIILILFPLGDQGFAQSGGRPARMASSPRQSVERTDARRRARIKRPGIQWQASRI